MANRRTRKWENSEDGKAWKKEYQRAYQQDYKDKVLTINIRIRKDSGILEALDEACLTNNVSRVEYLRLAVPSVWKRRGTTPDMKRLHVRSLFDVFMNNIEHRNIIF